MESVDLADIELVGMRLSSELHLLIRSLAPERHRTTDMAKWLGVDRTTCHRVIAASRRGDNGLRAIKELPGITGLRRWIEAVAEHAPDPQQVEALRAAADVYHSLINRCGGSRSAVLARIEGADKRDAPEEDEHAPPTAAMAERLRRESFLRQRRLLGQHCRALLSIWAFRPMPEDQTLVEQASIVGRVGIQCRRWAPPVAFGGYRPPRGTDPVSAQRRDLSNRPLQDPDARPIIQEFSTSPLPVSTVRTPDQRMITVLDNINAPLGAHDVFVGTRISPRTGDPATLDPPLLSVNIGVRVPTEWLLIDVYLHRSLARRCIPGIGVYSAVTAPLYRGDPAERWYDRLPGVPELRLTNADSPPDPDGAYSRYAELSHFAFDSLAWPSGQFVGHRCLVAWPIWGAEYMMTFDFADEP